MSNSAEYLRIFDSINYEVARKQASISILILVVNGHPPSLQSKVIDGLEENEVYRLSVIATREQIAPHAVDCKSKRYYVVFKAHNYQQGDVLFDHTPTSHCIE